MAGVGTTIYSTLFKRNSVFVGTIFATGFVFKIAFDMGTSALYDRANAGKQWKDIRHRYVEN
ncbi:Cytochrome b-c1 complex subunit 9, mitochondrial [Savitreella phatthalungensis]